MAMAIDSLVDCRERRSWLDCGRSRKNQSGGNPIGQRSRSPLRPGWFPGERKHDMSVVRIVSSTGRALAYYSPATGWVAFQHDRDATGAPVSVRALVTVLRALRAAGRAPRIVATSYCERDQ